MMRSGSGVPRAFTPDVHGRSSAAAPHRCLSGAWIRPTSTAVTITTGVRRRRRGRVGHRVTARAVAAVVVGCVALTTSAGSPAPAATADELDRALDDARARVRASDAQRAVTVDRLEAIGTHRAALDRELAQLEARLSATRATLARRRRQLARAVTGLVRLDRRARALRTGQREARDRVRASLRALTALDRVGVADAVLGAGSVGDAGHVAMYARAIADRHAAAVRDARRRQDATGAATRRLKVRRDDVAARTAAVDAERDRVAALVAQARQLRELLAEQAQRQQEALAAIEADRDRHAELVAALEAESARLTRRLRARAAAGASPRDVGGGMAWPADGPVTSPFGYRTHPISGVRRLHTGVDVGAAARAPVRAARRGEVVTAGWLGGYGNAVVIDHGGGLSTLYAHQSALAVGTGDSVRRGQVVGAVGATGFVASPHLHFEVRVDGVPTDPAAYR